MFWPNLGCLTVVAFVNPALLAETTSKRSKPGDTIDLRGTASLSLIGDGSRALNR